MAVSNAKVPSLSFGNSSALVVGDEIFVVGNPQGLEGTFSQGIVSGIRKLTGGSLLQITAPISPGSSGGPVLDSQGKVVGVAVATFRGGQNLNFAIPSFYLTQLLSNIKQVIPLAQKSSSGQAESFVSGLGERSTEGVVGENLIWDNQLWEYGSFTFTLRNQLQDNIKNVYCLVIFYSQDNKPLDIVVVKYDGIIPSGLGKRVTGSVDASVKKLTTPVARDNQFMSSLVPSTKIEARILDFQIVE